MKYRMFSEQISAWDETRYWWEMTPTEIAQALNDAADRVHQGWVRGSWIDEDDNVCLEGAIGIALGLNPHNMGRDASADRHMLLACPVISAVTDVLNEDPAWRVADADGGGYGWIWFGVDDLPNWNDVSDRTRDEVEDLLRYAAKRTLGVPGDTFTTDATTDATADAHAEV